MPPSETNPPEPQPEPQPDPAPEPPALRVEQRDDRRALAPVAAATPPRIMTAAQWAVLSVRAQSGDVAARGRLEDMRARFAATEDRADETIAGDITAAALPPAVVGDLVGRAVRLTPLLGVFTRYGLPETGMTFSRPKVTQHFLVDYQGAEKTALASRDVKFDADPVSIFTIGGWLNVSRQFIDRTPYWARVFDDMVTTWANFINGALGGSGDGATGIKGLHTIATAALPGGGFATGATVDGGTLSTAVYNAWAYLYSGPMQQGPDTAVMAPATWAKVGALVDASKRPLFPTIGPVNASGTASAQGPGGFYGLPVVLDASVPADLIYLCVRDALEFYSQPAGDTPFTLSVDEPQILGVETAIYSYIASFAKPGGIAVVKLGAAPVVFAAEDEGRRSSKAS